MREALAASAQRAAGARPTAEPFTRTLRRRVPAPPLRVGIACDVSGSMAAFAGPVASAAWIPSRAASLITGTRTATVIYGERVRPVTRPGHAPARVTDFTATDGTEKFCQAIDALDGALDLSRPGAARLLVIVSDGCYTPGERRDGQQRITRLASYGCGILWLAPGSPWVQPDGPRPGHRPRRPRRHHRRHRPRRHPRPGHPRRLTPPRPPQPCPCPPGRPAMNPAALLARLTARGYLQVSHATTRTRRPGSTWTARPAASASSSIPAATAPRSAASAPAPPGR